ncbi:MAG: hypothetical protein DI539_25875, partial [Flavobacterium psychrophilum]
MMINILKTSRIFFMLALTMGITGMNGIAQEADSIIKIYLHLSQRDFVDTLNTRGDELLFKKPTEARILFEKAIAIAVELNYKKGSARALKSEAVSYDLQGNSNEAIKLYLKALK